MDLVKTEDIYELRIPNEDAGDFAYREINYITTVNDWKKIVDQIINYNSGKLFASITSWLSRFNSILKPTITDSSLKSFPTTSKEWDLLIKNMYLTTLCTTKIKSSIETRVSIWNKNIYPFLIFLQDRDLIPVDVIFPKMKEVDQVGKNSSFNVTIIGEEEPYKVTHKDSLDRLIIPISLSRTDAEYLDEIYYDLERKRNKLHDCLTSYWKNLKDHFLLGRELMREIDIEYINRRINNKDYYNIDPRAPKNSPLNGKHFLGYANKKSFGGLLYSFRYKHGCAKTEPGNSCVPSRSTLYRNGDFYRSVMPKEYLEVEEDSLLRKLNWMLGCIDSRDISFITALLMMENPKFTVHALYNSRVEDKSGKQILAISEHNLSFSVNKQRAKDIKTENLSELSLEIISTLMEMRKDNLHRIPKNISKRLFVIRGSRSDSAFLAPSPQRATRYLSGAYHNKQAQEWLGNYFPSLEKAGIRRHTLNHKKLRDSEGVLEFFRTGSVKAVSRKIGNSEKVSLHHYLPKALIAAYNTRQVRRFQNLIIVAACTNKDYLLDAVDFNNLSELHNFIYDMLELDSNGTNPLLNCLRENMGDEQNLRKGDLIANISETSLSYLYAYNMVADQCNMRAETLSQKDIKTGLSPISFISLSKYLKNILSNHTESSVRAINDAAHNKALALSNKVSWDELLLKKEKLS